MGRPKKAKGPVIKKKDKSVPRPKGKKGIKPSARVGEEQYIEYSYKGIKMSIKERDQKKRSKTRRFLVVEIFKCGGF